MWEKSLKISHFEKLLVMLITSADVVRRGAIRSLAAASGQPAGPQRAYQ
nr:MAG TPA: hypothetical protein [Caudoviricetes sp.]